MRKSTRLTAFYKYLLLPVSLLLIFNVLITFLTEDENFRYKLTNSIVLNGFAGLFLLPFMLRLHHVTFEPNLWSYKASGRSIEVEYYEIQNCKRIPLMWPMVIILVFKSKDADSKSRTIWFIPEFELSKKESLQDFLKSKIVCSSDKSEWSEWLPLHLIIAAALLVSSIIL